MPVLTANTFDGEQVILSEEVVSQFKDKLHGSLMTSDHGDYETTRKVWNGMIDRRPALIARCAGVADVLAAVKFARAHEVLVSVLAAATMLQAMPCARAA